MTQSFQVRPSPTLPDLAESFLLSKRVAGCSPKTLRVYAHWTRLFVSGATIPLDSQQLQAFFTRLFERNVSASTRHQAYRTLKTFFLWGAAVGKLPEGLLRGVQVRLPKTLPQVPTEDELRSLLSTCSQQTEGKRNRAMLLVMADAGLRASELLRLLVEHWQPSERGLFVRAGKGSKDRVAFVSPVTARAIREYLASRPV
ncbi:MAG: hypothetical protein FJX78_06720, partial [Armatimonadetes bacterium]|nr:hypothetical protein [Armatimonadota bacterium]